jgi:hypothetical protein
MSRRSQWECSKTWVIPAKAGIQSVDTAFPKVCGVDSRFRGNDCDLQRPFLAKDTSTKTPANKSFSLTPGAFSSPGQAKALGGVWFLSAFHTVTIR